MINKLDHLVISDDAAAGLWEGGFYISSLCIAARAKSLSTAYENAIDLFMNSQSGNEAGWDALFGPLQTASTYDDLDMMQLSQEEHFSWKFGIHVAEDEAKLRELFTRSILCGIGFVDPRQPYDRPKLVPSDVWNGRINWADSSLKGNGLLFSGTKIVPRYLVERAISGEAEKVPPKKIGRPSVKSEIYEAFEALSADGIISTKNKMSEMYPLIRRYLSLQHPDRSGVLSKLSDETIRKEISPRLKILKSHN
ncbi:MAG: hypothetical protein ABJ388_11675 [Alphaproteobacteria bacterium]|uniref:hypothetical protein n=1 Tax=Nisaea sp. TaxID=2024842 RepID=UPI0032632FFD